MKNLTAIISFMDTKRMMIHCEMKYKHSLNGEQTITNTNIPRAYGVIPLQQYFQAGGWLKGNIDEQK